MLVFILIFCVTNHFGEHLDNCGVVFAGTEYNRCAQISSKLALVSGLRTDLVEHYSTPRRGVLVSLGM
jgi:hypothetical protein